MKRKPQNIISIIRFSNINKFLNENFGGVDKPFPHQITPIFLLYTLPPKVTLVLLNVINIGRADTIP